MGKETKPQNWGVFTMNYHSHVIFNYYRLKKEDSWLLTKLCELNNWFQRTVFPLFNWAFCTSVIVTTMFSSVPRLLSFEHVNWTEAALPDCDVGCRMELQAGEAHPGWLLGNMPFFSCCKAHRHSWLMAWSAAFSLCHWGAEENVCTAFFGMKCNR